VLAAPIEEGISGLKKKLESNVDNAWLYNAEQDRFYEYEELKSRREANPYPDQLNFPYIEMDKEELEKFKVDVLDNPNTFKLDYSNPQAWMPEPFDTTPGAPRAMLGECAKEDEEDESKEQNGSSSEDDGEEYVIE
jgi:hypothetical protein